MVHSKNNGKVDPSQEDETHFGDRVQGFEKKLESISHTAGEKMGEFVSGVSDSTAGYTQTGRDYIKENPFQSLLIAAAAGAVVGGLLTLLLRRKN